MGGKRRDGWFFNKTILEEINELPDEYFDVKSPQEGQKKKTKEEEKQATVNSGELGSNHLSEKQREQIQNPHKNEQPRKKEFKEKRIEQKQKDDSLDRVQKDNDRVEKQLKTEPSHVIDPQKQLQSQEIRTKPNQESMIRQLRNQVTELTTLNHSLTEELNQAKQGIGDILIAAKKQAIQFVEEGKAEAEQLIHSAEQEAEELVGQAKKISDEITQSRQTVSELYDVLQEKVDALLKNE